MDRWRREVMSCGVGLLLVGLSASLGESRVADQAPTGAPRTGSICLLSIAEPTSGHKSLYNYTGGNPPPEYSVQFGEGSIVQFPHSPKSSGPGVLITGMPLDRPYLVRIRHQGKPIESFRFRFDTEDRGSLCLFLSEFYLTWQLWPARHRPRACGCTGATTRSWESP